ncbi:MAG TPA: hypothetical protein VNI60_10815 [Pyrinomonadaceae bacterium]|nr:hypothetical protein [Pyrinomonadaceae bacterium]
MGENKIKLVEIKRFENERFLGSYIQTPSEANVLLDEINEAENGSWIARIIYMTQAEYDAIPEFEGY